MFDVILYIFVAIAGGLAAFLLFWIFCLTLGFFIDVIWTTVVGLRAMYRWTFGLDE